MYRENVLKQRLAKGESVFGCWVDTGSCTVIEILGHAGFDFVLPDGEQGFAIVIQGSGRTDELPLSSGRALSLPVGGATRITAGEVLRLACFCGRPLHEPVVRHGPFVMSNEGQVVAALQRFQSGGMGRLSPRQQP